MKFRVVSWTNLEKDCLLLAKKIRKSGKHFDEIVSITRGGMVVARILSDLLELPISHIAIQSYKQLTSKKPVITQFSPRIFDGESILLVDELSDTGKTFKRAVEYMQSLPIGDFVTAALYIKPQTTFIPDFWVENIDAWIIFPYELAETKRSFIKEFGKKAGLTKLKDLHIPDWEK